MVNSLEYGLVAALSASSVVASPIAESNNSPATYKPQPYKPQPVHHKPQPKPKPKPKPSKPKAPVCKNKTSQVANFDDLAGIPGLLFNDIPTPYKGLEYAGFDFTAVIGLGTGLQPGLAPSSGTQYAAANVVSQLQGTPTLTTIYPGSTIDSFNLESFTFGCVVQLLTGAAAVPSACNVQITSYTGNDNSVASAKQVCSQQFSFRPTTALGTVQLARSGPINKECKNLDFAVITFSLEGGSSALGPLSAFVFDDLKYTTCST